jgi:hypothetical protein
VKPYWNILAGAALSLVMGSAAAAPPKKPKAPPFDVAGTTVELASGDEARVTAALGRAKSAGKAAGGVAPVVEKMLARGLTTSLARAAIATVAELGQSTSVAAVLPYARHRDVEVRRAASAALARLGGAAAITALRAALSDGDARVRGTAASGLGALGARDAVPDLEAALDRKVFEAAAALGQLCAGAACDAFEARLGKTPFDVMTGGFDAILFRTDIKDDHKIKLVNQVRDVGTGEANKYLRDVQSRWSGAPAVKAALDAAVSATRGSPGVSP